MKSFILFLLTILISSSQLSEFKTVKSISNSDNDLNTFIQSSDGGITWGDASNGLPKDVDIRCALEQDHQIYVGTLNYGLFRSPYPQMGLWKKQTLGIPPLSQKVQNENQRIFSLFHGSTEPFIFEMMNGLMQNVAGTDTWKKLNKIKYADNIFSLLEMSKGKIIVGCSAGMFKSNDGGLNWDKKFSTHFVGNLVRLNNIILASVPNGVIRSVDDGEHWDYVFVDYESNYNISVFNNQYLIIKNSNTWRNLSEGVTYLSSPDGKTWNPEQINSPTSKPIINLVKFGNSTICSTEDGIFSSSDNGKNWKISLEISSNEKNKFYRLMQSKDRIFAFLFNIGC